MSKFSTRLAQATCAAMLWTAAVAQEATVLGQLPQWAQQQFASLAKARAVEVSTRINPFTWRGDFDGDDHQDFAVFIRAAKSKKEGIAIFRRTKPPIVMGAGTTLGNGGDDFSWLDTWSVIEGEAEADRLHVAKESSASAVLSVEHDKATWQQEGD